MIELVHILRTLNSKGVRQVARKDLEKFLLDLWDSERISIYSTFDRLHEDLQMLAEFFGVRYDSKMVTMSEDFMQKTERVAEMTLWWIGGNAYLKHVFETIKRHAEEFANRLRPPEKAMVVVS